MRELNQTELREVAGGCRDYSCELPTPIVELVPNLVQRRATPGFDFLPSPDPFLPIEASQ